MSLNPYLYFDGQCEEAFQFYETRLGGKITFMMTYEGSPMASQTPPGYAKRILHAGLTLGDGVIEGCDAPPGQYKKPQSFCIMFRPKNAAEADRTSLRWRKAARYRFPLQRPSGLSGLGWLLIALGCRG
jgi:PhnB protein